MTTWVPPNADHPPPKAGEPELHRAARVGDADAIRALVRSGAPVDDLFDIALGPGASPEPVTPLMVAAGSGDGAGAETVRLLLDLGASTEPGPTGVSALWYACAGLGWNYPPGGDLVRVRVLLSSGADPNDTRPPRRAGRGPGVSALAGAAETGNVELLRLLLEAGASPDPAGATAPGQVPLHIAAESGSADCVRLLLDAGADPNRTVGRSEAPVLASAASSEVLAELLRAGADPHAPCRFDSVAYAVARQDRATVPERSRMLGLLVDAGVDLDHPIRHATPLYGAAMTPDPSAVEALLLAGANVHASPPPLSAACFLCIEGPHSGTDRIIDLLIAAGADPNDEDERGYRPLHTALGADTFGPGYQESDGFNLPAALALMRHGASIDITFPGSGYRPLHAAAAASSPEMITALLAAGADPTERDLEGNTPLAIARRTLGELVDDPPTLEKARAMDLVRTEQHDPEAVATRRLEGWLKDHRERVERATGCVDLLT